MGSYLPGDTVFIQAGVRAVDANDHNLYTLMTTRGKFYASELEDKMIMDPNDGFTSTEFYNICYYIHESKDNSGRISVSHFALTKATKTKPNNTPTK